MLLVLVCCLAGNGVGADAGGVGAGSFGLVPNLYILNFNGAIPPELLSIYKIMV